MNPSRYYMMLIENLYAAAISHKKHCEENCNVSLTRIQWAAAELSQYLDRTDLEQYNTLQWPF